MNYIKGFNHSGNLRAKLITQDKDVRQIISDIENSDRKICIDTEFMRETTYWPQLCLIQICVNDNVYCIDVLCQDIDEKTIVELCSLDVLWIIHAAKQDFEIIYRLCGSLPKRYFDTQIAAELCGVGEQVSYAALVEHITGNSLDKSQTRTQWQRRPLSQAQLVYAAEDVAYLTDVYEYLNTKIATLGRLEWLEEENAVLLEELIQQSDTEQAYKRVRKGAAFPAKTQFVIKSLAVWREKEAVSKDVTRNRIFNNDLLFNLADAYVRNQPQLSQHLAVAGKYNSKNEIEQVLKAGIEEWQTKQAGDTVWPERRMLSKSEKEHLRQWQHKIQTTAEEQSLIASRFAKRSDLEQWLFDNSGKLTEGWRKQFLQKHFSE